MLAKSLPLPPKSAEVLSHKRWSDPSSSIHPRDMKAFMWWLLNKKIHCDQSQYPSLLLLEWIHRSGFLCKVYQSWCWCGCVCGTLQSLETGGQSRVFEVQTLGPHLFKKKSLRITDNFRASLNKFVLNSSYQPRYQEYLKGNCSKHGSMLWGMLFKYVLAQVRSY